MGNNSWDKRVKRLIAMDSDAYHAHEFSSNHRKSLEQDAKCGCFYCLEIFKPSEIEEWVDGTEEEVTALCPYCEIDSVIGESSAYPITKEFLGRMNQMWFGGSGIDWI